MAQAGMKRTDGGTEQKTAEAILRIEQACFAEPWSLSSLLYQLNTEDTVYRILNCGDVSAGFALGTDLRGEAELYRLAVLPEYRRKGFGETLLREFLTDCARRGAKRVFLEVRSKNLPAVSLYQKTGFRQIAVRKGYYGDDDAAVMEFSPERDGFGAAL